MKKTTTGPASRYAKALFELGLEAGLDTVSPSLLQLQTVLSESDDLAAVLAHETLSAADKKSVLEKVMAEMKAPQLISNFVALLADKKRADVLADVLVAYFAFVEEHNGVTRASVKSAHSLTDTQRAEVLSFVKGKVENAKEIVLEEFVDADLIAGVQVRIGTTQYDASAQGRLNSMRQVLLGSAGA